MSTGRGDDGRLGHGDNGWKYVPRITQSLAGQVVVQVTCGSYHTAAVTGNGDLYTWYVLRTLLLYMDGCFVVVVFSFFQNKILTTRVFSLSR
jgi:hypothetical protein